MQKYQQSANTEQVYNKANSFTDIAGSTNNSGTLKRIRHLYDNIGSIPSNFRAVVKQACSDIFNKPNHEERLFTLQKMVLAEIDRLEDKNLARYLNYRYRYDIYPQDKKIDDFPPCVQIEPTSICNYRCVFCYQTDKNLTQGKHGHMGMMSLDLFKNIIDQIEGNVEAVTLASRGEPLMAKSIIPMLMYASKKFLAFKINTNASFLNEEKIHALLSAEPNTLVFSADAADSDLYAKLRVNGDLDKVVSNIKLFSDIRQKHYPQNKTIVRVSGVRYSKEQHFEDIEKFWGRYTDQVAFVSYNPWESAYDAQTNNIQDHCSDLWRRTFVWWDGTINPCDVDYRSTLAVGNIRRELLTDVWQGSKYHNLRNLHSNKRRCEITPCNGCILV